MKEFEAFCFEDLKVLKSLCAPIFYYVVIMEVLQYRRNDQDVLASAYELMMCFIMFQCL